MLNVLLVTWLNPSLQKPAGFLLPSQVPDSLADVSIWYGVIPTDPIKREKNIYINKLIYLFVYVNDY